MAVNKLRIVTYVYVYTMHLRRKIMKAFKKKIHLPIYAQSQLLYSSNLGRVTHINIFSLLKKELSEQCRIGLKYRRSY